MPFQDWKGDQADVTQATRRKSGSSVRGYLEKQNVGKVVVRDADDGSQDERKSDPTQCANRDHLACVQYRPEYRPARHNRAG